MVILINAYNLELYHIFNISYLLGVFSNKEYEVHDSIKITTGDPNDMVLIQDQPARYKCLQFCNKLLDCAAVNIGRGLGSAVSCQILKDVPQENDKVTDVEWQLLLKN